MALKRISDLTPATTPLVGTEELELDVSGAARKCTAQDIADLATGGGGGSDRSAVSALTSSGSVSVDYSLGDYFTLALSGNVSGFTFTNMPGSGKGATLTIAITQDSTARTVTWPASFRWAVGSVQVVSTAAGAVDLLVITTLDNGTTWLATLAKAWA